MANGDIIITISFGASHVTRMPCLFLFLSFNYLTDGRYKNKKFEKKTPPNDIFEKNHRPLFK
jgi:hypothetical protein